MSSDSSEQFKNNLVVGALDSNVGAQILGKSGILNCKKSTLFTSWEVGLEELLQKWSDLAIKQTLHDLDGCLLVRERGESLKLAHFREFSQILDG